jgi:TATA-box binding protein (TBP) (component of TFIID and TFIIIB)
MSVFQTGKIIITGGRYLYQLEEAYNFLNRVLQDHAEDVLRIPTDQEQSTVRPNGAVKLTAKA